MTVHLMLQPGRGVKRGSELPQTHTVSLVKHGGGSIVVLGCISLTAAGKLVRVYVKTSRSKYRTILGENLLEAAK